MDNNFAFIASILLLPSLHRKDGARSSGIFSSPAIVAGTMEANVSTLCLASVSHQGSLV